MTQEREIRELIKKIAGTNGVSSLFITAQVVSVSSETCTVKRNGVQLTDVRLNAMVSDDKSTKNLIIKPTVGSTVMLADLSGGLYRDLAVIGWSGVDSININGTITINGGKQGGLINIADLKTNLDNLKSYVEAMNTALPAAFTAVGAALQANGATASGSYTTSMTGQAITFKNMEDTNIKH